MNLFDTLLEIKTGKKGLKHKVVYIDNPHNWVKGRYFIYYYDLESHSFYINDLEWPTSNNTMSAMKYIDLIIKEAYKQEIDLYWAIFKKILKNKRPKVFCFYYKHNDKFIIIDKVNLKDSKYKSNHIYSSSST